jgi:hypothetical protein
MHPASPDNEERRLLAEYETATQYYSWAVGEQSRQRGIRDRENYRKLFQLADDAFAECERARTALKKYEPNRFGTHFAIIDRCGSWRGKL